MGVFVRMAYCFFVFVFLILDVEWDLTSLVWSVETWNQNIDSSCVEWVNYSEPHQVYESQTKCAWPQKRRDEKTIINETIALKGWARFFPQRFYSISFHWLTSKFPLPCHHLLSYLDERRWDVSASNSVQPVLMNYSWQSSSPAALPPPFFCHLL